MTYQYGPLSKNAFLNQKSEELKGLELEMVDTLSYVYNIFIGIEALCFSNLMFFLQQIISLIFIKKMGRDI